MTNAITALMSADHDRLDAELAAALAAPDLVASEAYGRFRAGLLRHIGMEEKILFPAARRANGDRPVEGFAQLREEHGRIVSLLVPPPTLAIVAELRALLGPHNLREEAPGGMYALCEVLLHAESEAVLERLRTAPEVPVRPFSDAPRPKPPAP